MRIALQMQEPGERAYGAESATWTANWRPGVSVAVPVAHAGPHAGRADQRVGTSPLRRVAAPMHLSASELLRGVAVCGVVLSFGRGMRLGV